MQGFDSNSPATRSPVESEPVRRNFQAVATTHYGPTAPADPSAGWMWIDSSDAANIKLKAFLNNVWVTILTNITGGAPSQSTVDQVVHTQASAATLWTINHNLNTKNIVTEFWDGSNQKIIPDVVQVVTVNQITASFNSAQSGRAVILG